jgi:hypothetical protein
MARNKLSDLRDHMFAALERIDDDQLTPEQLKNEIDKAKSIAMVGSVIINSAKVEVDYIKATGMIESESDLFKTIISQRQIN